MSNGNSSPAMRRIEELLDENSFVELMSEVTSRTTDFNESKSLTPSDGVITGHGLIDGNLVFVYSQDPEVLGGTVGEMHARKIVSVYRDAMKVGAPVIGLIDSQGVRLQESFDAETALGNLIAAAGEASGTVPVITCVMGQCGGGLSVLAGLSDFTFMTDKAELFLNSPDSIKGNKGEDTSSADFHSRKTGLAMKCDNEETLFGKVRTLVTLLPASCDEGNRVESCDDDLNRGVSLEDKLADPMAFAIETADDNKYFSINEEYGKSMETGFLRLNGALVAFIGNREQDENESVLSTSGVEKALSMVKFADAFNIPILTLTNVTGYDRTVHSEYSLLRKLSGLVCAFADADVPKINLYTKKAYGSALALINSKSLGADICYAYPDSDLGIMDSTKAAKIIAGDNGDLDSVREEFEDKASGVLNAARRGLVDRIINKADTRKYLISGFEMLYSKREKLSIRKHSTK